MTLNPIQICQLTGTASFFSLPTPIFQMYSSFICTYLNTYLCPWRSNLKSYLTNGQYFICADKYKLHSGKFLTMPLRIPSWARFRSLSTRSLLLLSFPNTAYNFIPMLMSLRSTSVIRQNVSLTHSLSKTRQQLTCATYLGCAKETLQV